MGFVARGVESPSGSYSCGLVRKGEGCQVFECQLFPDFAFAAGYPLMPNHEALVLRTVGRSLWRAMGWLGVG